MNSPLQRMHGCPPVKETYIPVNPSPASLVESMRDIGYCMESAVADLIDNSLAAGARKIRLRYSWDDGMPWFMVADDGHGMMEHELADAMRLGCRNPLDERDEADLGRFGLGLKTASFSQCRLMTVISRRAGVLSAMEWDLDFIADDPKHGWRIRKLDLSDEGARAFERELDREYLGGSDGTIVLWRKLDRYDESEKKLLELVNATREHLELTFHRFLTPRKGRRSISISLNDAALEAFNPFFPEHAATQEGPQQLVQFEGEKIFVTPWVLPHHSKVSAEQWKRYACEGGYLHNQGFYVYRARRLIIRGTWFRLKKKEELTKLIRVQVDIPNSLDHRWKINVNKSHASPPEPVRDQLRAIIETISDSGKRVYKRRGAKLRQRSVPVWTRTAGSGESGAIFYTVNREHELIQRFRLRLSDEQRKHFDNILRVIESSFPMELFYSDMAGVPENVRVPDCNRELLENLIATMTDRAEGQSERDAILEQLRDTEPFASVPALTAELLEQYGYNGGGA